MTWISCHDPTVNILLVVIVHALSRLVLLVAF
jgi:hypothetical protein